MTLEKELKEYDPKEYFIHDSVFDKELTIEYVIVENKRISKSTFKRTGKTKVYVISNLDDTDMRAFIKLQGLKEYIEKEKLKVN